MKRRHLPVLLLCCAPLAAAEEAADARRGGTYRVVRIETGLGYAEGPAWSPEGYLIFSDVPAGRLFRLTPGERAVHWGEPAAGPSGNAFDSSGRLVSCQTRARRVVRYDRKGSVEVLAERWEGKRLNAPNDLAVRKDGHIYFTDPAFGYQQDTRELDFYGIFHITPRRELKLVAKSAGRPNGVALAPNGRRLYVSDSDRREVRAWDLDRRGEASNERVLIRDIEAVPGGIRVDEKGHLYVAAKGIAVYSPEGRRLSVIPVEERPSNCAFGDPDGKSLYITARTSIYRVRLEGEEPQGESSRQ